MSSMIPKEKKKYDLLYDEVQWENSYDGLILKTFTWVNIKIVILFGLSKT